MSIEATSWALKQKLKNPGAKFVLLILANYADENGECYPSQQHLSEITGYKPRTILNHINFLEEKNLIKKRKRRTKNGTFFSNVYQVQILPTVKNNHTQNLHPVHTQILPTAKSAHYTKESYKEDTKDLDKKDEDKKDLKSHTHTSNPREKEKKESVCVSESEIWKFIENKIIHIPPLQYQNWTLLVNYFTKNGLGVKKFAVFWKWFRGNPDFAQFKNYRVKPENMLNYLPVWVESLERNHDAISDNNPTETTKQRIARELREAESALFDEA